VSNLERNLASKDAKVWEPLIQDNLGSKPWIDNLSIKNLAMLVLPEPSGPKKAIILLRELGDITSNLDEALIERIYSD
jgi:hypothetical protein